MPKQRKNKETRTESTPRYVVEKKWVFKTDDRRQTTNGEEGATEGGNCLHNVRLPVRCKYLCPVPEKEGGERAGGRGGRKQCDREGVVREGRSGRVYSALRTR